MTKRRRKSRYVPPYIPQSRIHLIKVRGVYMPPVPKPAIASMMRVVKDIERRWFVPEAKGGHYACASLRRMSSDMWNELMDALPRCECGRAVAPSRAKLVRFGRPYCSTNCRQKYHSRRWCRTVRAVRRRARREAAALSEAIG